MSSTNAARIIAVANAKGGTGKTNTTVGLACEAAHRGNQVLAIDLDEQGNLTTWLIGDPDQNDQGKAVHRALTDGDELVSVPSRVENLSLCPGGFKTKVLADELKTLTTEVGPDRINDLYAASRENFRAASKGYDYVFVDTPPAKQSQHFLNFVYASADYTIHPAKIDENSCEAVVDALTAMVRLHELGIEVADPLGIVLVDADVLATKMLSAAATEVYEAVGEALPVFDQRIGHRVTPAVKALKHRMSFRQLADHLEQLRTEGTPASDPKSSRYLVADYEALFDEVEQRIEADLTLEVS